MFALASDLLRYVQVDVQGPHLVIPDRCVLNSQPLRLARCGTWQRAGPSWRPDAIWPLASTAGFDVTAGRLPVGCGTGKRLDPDDIGVPWVGGKNLTPEGLARDPRPLDTDPPHCLSPPRPVVAGPN